VHVGNARLKSCGFFAVQAGYACGLAILVLLFASRALQNAVAEGDTRTISMHHVHTGEDITITYKRDGQYDEAALEKLNWFLRDWRRAQETRMDPHLIDLVWEVQRETGTSEPIQIVCGYRSPETNAMLRRHSSGVARFSQHMLGKAMDFYIPGVPLSELRMIGLRLQRGGVGFYPTSGSPFVHMDTGGIRMWPRMTREELVKVFPDGRTVHIPTDGRPLPGYALALADIRQRGSDPSENSIEAARNAGIDVSSAVAANQHAVNPFAKLLGLAKNEDDEDADGADADPTAATAPAAPHAKPAVLAKLEHAAAKTVAVARASATAAPKLLHAAATVTRAEAAQSPATTPTDQSTSQIAALSANQVITSRGYWEGSPDAMSAAQPAAKPGSAKNGTLRTQGTEIASADPVATGSATPWSNAADDRVSPKLALAYAEQPGSDTPPLAAATASASRPADDPAGHLIAETGTTIAVKGIIDRPKTQIQKATQVVPTAVKVDAKLDSPWLRAIVVSPSVSRFLTTLALGVRDYTALAAMMIKPASSVMMTFSSDPNLGLTPDHFSGSAIVFVSTVTYPTHTASLQ
jgi:uncharacterized protein YcbK (DUF882 family)